MKYLKAFEQYTPPEINSNEDDIDKDLDGLELKKGQIDLSEARKYLLAGKCIATFVNNEKNSHLTYKVSKAKNNKNLYFVSALCGPDNTSNYKYIGIIRINNSYNFSYGDKSTVGKDSKIVKAFETIWSIINRIANDVTYLSIKDGKPVITRNVESAFCFNNENEAIKYALSNNLENYLINNITLSVVDKNKKMVYIQKKASTNKNLEMWHSSHCCRCGRKLTVKDSIMAGMGNVCASLIAMGK